MDSAKSVAQISKIASSDKAKSSVQAKPSDAQVTTNPSPKLNITENAITSGGSSSSIEIPRENRVQKLQRLNKEAMMKQKLQPKKKKVATKKPKVDLVELNRVSMEIAMKESGDLTTSGDTAPEISNIEAADKPSATGETEVNVNEVIKEFLSSITEEVVTEVTPSFETPNQDLAIVVYTGPVHTPVIDLSAKEPVVTPIVDTVLEKEPDVETVLLSTNVAADEGMQTEKATEDTEFCEIL